MERISRTYANTAEKLEELQDAQTKLEEKLEADRALAEDLEKKWRQHQELGVQEQKLKSHEVRYCWADYNEAQEKCDEQKQVRLVLSRDGRQ